MGGQKERSLTGFMILQKISLLEQNEVRKTCPNNGALCTY